MNKSFLINKLCLGAQLFPVWCCTESGQEGPRSQFKLSSPLPLPPAPRAVGHPLGRVPVPAGSVSVL